MKFSELIDLSIECIKTFNPVFKTIDTHADDFLKDVSLSPRCSLAYLKYSVAKGSV
jgi:hypothetical protein